MHCRIDQFKGQIMAAIQVYEPGVKDALMQVWMLGQEDGNEHLIIVRDGKVHQLWQGESGSVNMPAGYKDWQRGDIIVHNHPGHNSLSNADLYITARVGAAWVYAINDDRDVFKGRILLDSNRPVIAQVWQAEGAYHNAFLKLGVHRANGKLLSHRLNKLVESMGLIDYQYDLADGQREPS